LTGSPEHDDTSSRDAQRSQRERAQERSDIARALRVGLFVWPAFFLLDLAMIHFFFPAAQVLRFAVLRALEEAVLFASYRLARRPTTTLAVARTGQALSFNVAALLIALMALDFGGPSSPYIHGESIVVLVHSTFLPKHWKRGLLALAPVGLLVVGVVLAACAVVPALRSQWLTGRAMLVFGSHFVFVVAAIVVAVTSGHVVWSVRKQVYEARRLGRYRLMAKIGRGGTSEVWLAVDDRTGRRVALKILHEEGAAEGSGMRAFEREARSVSRLRGPHTVRLIDFGASDDGIAFLSMEYLPGANLAELVRSHGPLPPARAVRFALQACESIIEAHDVGIIHRDLKPENLRITHVGDDPDFLKLLDFGLARANGGAEATETRPGFLHGTPAYLAPEIVRGHRADAKSDVYSFGATLFFMLTGRIPFEGHVQRILAAHVSEAPPSVSEVNSSIPRELADLVARCLRKNPAERPATFREVRDALGAVPLTDRWTAADARWFWNVARPEKLARMDAVTARVSPAHA
jgi:serine/threonine-protein kinase